MNGTVRPFDGLQTGSLLIDWSKQRIKITPQGVQEDRRDWKGFSGAGLFTFDRHLVGIVITVNTDNRFDFRAARIDPLLEELQDFREVIAGTSANIVAPMMVVEVPTAEVPAVEQPIPLVICEDQDRELIATYRHPGPSIDDVNESLRRADRLIEDLSDPELDVRLAACAAIAKIGKVGKLAPKFVPALVSALKNDDKDLKGAAVLALGEIGPPASDAVPFLIAILDGADDFGHIPRIPGGFFESMARSVLGDPPNRIYGLTIVALGQIGPSASAAAPQLVKALDCKVNEIRSKAAVTLGQIGLVTPAIPRLIEITKEATEKLEAISLEPKEWFGIPALFDDRPADLKQLRKSCLIALKQIGFMPEVDVTVFHRLTGDESEDTISEIVGRLSARRNGT